MFQFDTIFATCMVCDELQFRHTVVVEISHALWWWRLDPCIFLRYIITISLLLLSVVKLVWLVLTCSFMYVCVSSTTVPIAIIALGVLN
jgi:hypothetical protein